MLVRVVPFFFCSFAADVFASKFLPDRGLDEEDFAVYHWDVTNWTSLPSREVSPEFECAGYRWRILLFPRGNASPTQPSDMVSLYLDCADFSSPLPAAPTGLANGGVTPDSAQSQSQGQATITPADAPSLSSELSASPPPPGVLIPRGPKSYPDHVCAQFVLAMSNPNDATEFINSQASHRFVTGETDWGFTRFAELRSLSQPLPGKSRPIIERQAVRITAYVRAIKDETGVLWHNFVGYDSKQSTGFVGLKNQGATCYMNSLLQSLYCTNMFRRAVYEIPTEGESPSDSVALALQRVFYHLQSSEQPVGTTELTKSFGWKSLDSFLQHDVQEFNRVLQDKLESSMKGTAADGMINKLFVGKMKSYIRCINVDYESSRVEDFYDIQLNVKGMRNLMDSFRDYVQVERLDGDNQYQAEGYGLQDAMKGVIFESFPPVLHLQLKRFEYDLERDAMVKINDRHEFPLEIDLGEFIDKDSELYGQDWKYSLHGVLVHSGDLTGGHYFALIKPDQQGKWYRFDDDRVTPATEREVLEENYGGEEYIRGQPPERRQPARFVNAYMLVYIRNAEMVKVLDPFGPQDVPAHLAKRIEQERLELEAKQRERQEQHLFLTLRLISEDSFRKHQGFDLAQLDEHTLSLVDVPCLKVRKKDVFADVKEQIAKEYNAPSSSFRVWALVNRQNKTIRPDLVIPDDVRMTIEQVREQYASRSQELRLFIEFDVSALSPEVLQRDNKWIMIFLKRFVAQDQTLTGFARVYVLESDPVGSLVPVINELLQRPASTSVKLYEEVKPTMIEPMQPTLSFIDSEIQTGDVICFQEDVRAAEASQLAAEGKYINPKDFYDFLLHKRDVTFKPVPGQEQQGLQSVHPQPEFVLPLHRNISYDALAQRVAAHLQWDKNKIRFSYLHEPHLVPIKSTAHLGLGNSLSGHYFSKPVLFYELLDVPLVELESKLRLKVFWMGLHNKEESERTYLLDRGALLNSVQEELAHAENLPDQAHNAVLRPGADGTLVPTLEAAPSPSLANSLSRASRVRLFYIQPHGRSQFIFSPDEYIDRLADDPEVFAEEVPAEELDLLYPRRAKAAGLPVPDLSSHTLIEVAHFTKDPNRPNGVPFRFVLHAQEPLAQLKGRMRARLNLPEKEFAKIKFALLRPQGYYMGAEYLVSDDEVLFDKVYKGDVLGLDHIDRSNRGHRLAAASAQDRGIRIS